MKNKRTVFIMLFAFLFMLITFAACSKGGLEPIVVTDEHGQPITDEHGEVITVIPVTQVIVITDANGEDVTDEKGNVVTTIEYESQTVPIPVTDDKGNVVGTTNIHVPMPDDPPPTTAVIIPPSSTPQGAPNYVKYEKSFGGSGEDEFVCVKATTDGGFVAALNTTSLDGDIPVGDGFWGSLAVLCKYDKDGNIQWKKALGGHGNTSINGIFVAPNGDIFITGSTKDTTAFTINADYDGFVQKYDASGNLKFTSTWGGSLSDLFYDVATDSSGNIYAVGVSFSADGAAASLNISSADSKAVVVKFDANGNLVNSTGVGSWQDVFYDIEINSNDELFACGSFSSKTATSLFVNKGWADVGLVKFDSALNQIWAKSWGGSKADVVNGIATTTDGGVIAIGHTKSTDGNLSGVGNKGDYDAFIVKWNSEGSVAWYDTCAGAKADSFTGVFVDTDGTIYVSGHSESTTRDFHLLGNLGKKDAFIAKYSASGIFTTIKSVGGTNDDAFLSLCKLSDGSFVGVGYSNSKDRGFSIMQNPSDNSKKKGVVVKITMD